MTGPGDETKRSRSCHGVPSTTALIRYRVEAENANGEGNLPPLIL